MNIANDQATTKPAIVENNVLTQLFLIIRNYKVWKHWKKIKKGIKTKDLKRGCGYYITVGILGYNAIGKVEELEMESGKIGLYELIDYKTYSDPSDMIKESWWHFIGYKSQKGIKECSFTEAMYMYFR